MRSRYTAFVAGFPDYLLTTWHPDTRPATLELSGEQKWLGLRIRQCIQGGANGFSGIVAFVARYKINGKGYRLHEFSRFSKEAGQWFYLDGELKS
ncbi:MAG: hypothetical protein KDI36_18250 [Pseudomonadales bacterium]|nr:hypothetical protein [Pseudomonadales bacterium]